MSRSSLIGNLVIRNKYLYNFKPSLYVSSQERCFSKNNDKDDDTKPKGPLKVETDGSTESRSQTLPKDDTDKKAAAKKKLFSLLTNFEVESSNKRKVASNLNLVKAVKRPTKAERFKDVMVKLSPKEELQMAVKNVAENISGNPEDTKVELNEKLSSLDLVDPPHTEKVHYEEAIKDVDEEMRENIMSSVKEVATTVTDINPTAAIKSKLTQRLLRLSVDQSDTLPRNSLELLKDMKIEKRVSQSKKAGIPDKAKYSQREMQRPRMAMNIFQSPPLDIFSLDEEPKLDPKKTVWQHLEEKNLKLLVQFAPTNGFEEMILWTEQGKHWKFPIDNEIDMGDEENVGFNEHVFLEHHLHGFPTKGPVRIFMELVIVGLSKNPYITVERKIENIDWFRNYFKEKEEILKHHGALG